MLKFFQNASDVTPRANPATGAKELNPFDQLPTGAPGAPHQRKASASSMLASASGSRTPTSKSYPALATPSTSSPSASFFGAPSTPGDVTPGGLGGPGFTLGAVPVTPGGRATTGEFHSFLSCSQRQPVLPFCRCVACERFRFGPGELR